MQEAEREASIMAMVTILQVVPRLDTGGSEQATVEIAEALDARRRHRPGRHRGRPHGTRRHARGRRGHHAPRREQESVHHSRQCQAPRSSHQRERASISCTRGAERRPGARSSPRAAPADPSSPPITAPMAVSGPSRPLYNSVMARGDRVIANSRYTAQADRRAPRRGAGAYPHHLSRHRQCHLRSCCVVPPGPVAKLRERWGVTPETKIVLHAARLTSLKGQRRRSRRRRRSTAEGALDGAVIVLRRRCAGKQTAYRQELIGLIARHGLATEDPACRPLRRHAVGLPRRPCRDHSLAGPGNLRPHQHRGASHGLPGHRAAISARCRRRSSRPRQGRSGFTGWLVPPRDAEALADRDRARARAHAGRSGRRSARGRSAGGAIFELSQMQTNDACRL